MTSAHLCGGGPVGMLVEGRDPDGFLIRFERVNNQSAFQQAEMAHRVVVARR